MIYELRAYRCMPGRLPALLARFEHTTLAIWQRHGIRPAGFWTTLVGESNHELALHAGLGEHGRERAGRTHCRQCPQRVPTTHGVLDGALSSARPITLFP